MPSDLSSLVTLPRDRALDKTLGRLVLAHMSLSDPLWKLLTSTVGLVTTRNGETVNVQSAEWTYFVAKSPITVAVVIHESNLSHDLLAESSEFTVTLCSESQADLADFCGSFSGRDVAKMSSDRLEFGVGRTTETPWVKGGVVALECSTTQRVPLPEYSMVIGEVTAVHGEHPAPRPLVKHDGMFSLGGRAERTAVTAGASLTPDGLSVCAVSGRDGSEPYRVVLLNEHGERVHEQNVHANDYGDLNTTIVLPEETKRLVRRVAVRREGVEAGFATL